MSTEPTILTEIHPSGYAVVTLNRPQARNALSSELMMALTKAVDELEADPAVRVLIVTGAGNAFCAGLDLKELGAGGMKVGQVAGAAEATPRGMRDPVRALERFSGPIIGAINGAAATGGFELALACDVLLASPNARFADTHARIGVMPGWGLSQKLSRAIGQYRAREVSLTGNWVSAEQAEKWGFVNRVVPADELMTAARQLATDMLGTIPEMLVNYKAVLNEGFAMSFGDGMKLERARADAYNSQVTADGIESRREGVRARNRGA